MIGAVGAGSVATPVLVHGAWAGGWVWDRVVDELRTRGRAAAVVELPGFGEPEERSTLEENVARVAEVVREIAGPVVLVGHSGGGITVTQAAERFAERIAGVVFVAGIMLPSGVDFDALRAQFGGGADIHPLDGRLEPALGGRGTSIPPDVAMEVFFADAAPTDAAAAAARLCPQWNRGLELTPTWTADRLGSLPRVYIETTLDRDIPLRLQRHMQDRSPGAHAVTLDRGHVPQLTAPDEVADAIELLL